VKPLSSSCHLCSCCQRALCNYSCPAKRSASSPIKPCLLQYMVALLMPLPHLQTQSSMFCLDCRPGLHCLVTSAGTVRNVLLHLQAQSPCICQIQAALLGPGQLLCTASTLHGCHSMSSPTHHHQTPAPRPCLTLVCQAAKDSWCRSTLQDCMSSATCCKAEPPQRY